MEKGYIVYSGNVGPEALKPLLAGTVVASYKQLENQPMEIKEKLAGLVLKPDGAVVVQVDHSFMVKGVGTVALGVVKQGTVKKHDTLSVYPGKMKVLVKNIQVHDVDEEEASVGSRVGLALKDVKPEDVSRGSLIAADGAVKTSSMLEVEVSLSKYAQRPLNVQDTFLANSCVNYSPAKVLEGSVSPGASGRLRLALEKEIPLFGGRVAYLDPGLKMPRIFAYSRV
jgi:selenocysteine-specific translation elongation factor